MSGSTGSGVGSTEQVIGYPVYFITVFPSSFAMYASAVEAEQSETKVNPSGSVPGTEVYVMTTVPSTVISRSVVP